MSQYEYTNYTIIDLKDVQFNLLPYTVVDYNFNYCGKSFKNMFINHVLLATENTLIMS